MALPFQLLFSHFRPCEIEFRQSANAWKCQQYHIQVEPCRKCGVSVEIASLSPTVQRFCFRFSGRYIDFRQKGHNTIFPVMATLKSPYPKNVRGSHLIHVFSWSEREIRGCVNPPSRRLRYRITVRELKVAFLL